jgi:hypothetical protein
MTAILLLAALGALRQVTYPGAHFGGQPIPKFERGNLLFLGRSSELTVYEPLAGCT